MSQKQWEIQVTQHLHQIMTGVVGKKTDRAVRFLAEMVASRPPDHRGAIMDKIVKLTVTDYLANPHHKMARATYDQLAAALGEQALEWKDVRYLTKYFALVDPIEDILSRMGHMILSVGFFSSYSEFCRINSSILPNHFSGAGKRR